MKNTTNSKNMKYFYFFVLWLKGYETPLVVTRSLCKAVCVWACAACWTDLQHSLHTLTVNKNTKSIFSESSDGGRVAEGWEWWE